MRTSNPLARFAFRGLGFALPLAILLGWMELGLRAMANSYSVKRQQLESIAPNLEVIVTGSSGVFSGVDPSRFGVPAYNLANGNQTMHYDVEILSRYLDQMPRLRVVVLAECYWALGLDIRNTRESWRQHFYAVFWQVPGEEPDHRLVTIQKYSYIALYTPMTAAKAAMVGFHLPGFEPQMVERFRRDGWNPVKAPSEEEHATGMSSSWTRLRVEGQKNGMRPATQERNVRALRALAERLRVKGIQLALVWIPVSTEYTKWFGPETVAEQRAAQQDLATSPNVRFFDYASDTRFQSEDFFDGDHLGPRGAPKFSDILASEVVTPLLKLAGERGAGHVER